MELKWTYNNVIFDSSMIGDNYGFVYVIKNLETNKKYIGKKLFYSTKTKQVKGKKKRIKVLSDWETYFGSNDELKKDLQIFGEAKFCRKIIHLCKSKGECNYLEAKEQFVNEVMEKDDYYNNWIMVRVRKSHIKGYNARIS
jgi:hypothetical protein